MGGCSEWWVGVVGGRGAGWWWMVSMVGGGCLGVGLGGWVGGGVAWCLPGLPSAARHGGSCIRLDD